MVSTGTPSYACTAHIYMSMQSKLLQRVTCVPMTGLILRHIEILLFLISVEITVSESITGARQDFYLPCWDTSDCSDILLF